MPYITVKFLLAHKINLVPDFESLFSEVHGDDKGPEGSKLRLERVPVCSSILVEGINANTSMDTIQLYFESNRHSGGDIVSHVERITKSSAIVHFEKASGKIVFNLSFRFRNTRRNF